MSNTISRRDFLKTAAAGAVGAAGLVAIGGLSGCAQEVSTNATEQAPVTDQSSVEQVPASSESTVEQAPAFDEGSIVLTFAAMADAHIMSKSSQESSEDLMASMGISEGDLELAGDVLTMAQTTFHTNDHMIKGLQFLEELAGGRLDCLAYPGDLTNTGTKEDAEKFYSIFVEGLKHPDTPLIFCTGNHDLYAGGAGNGGYLRQAFDDALYSADIVSDGPENSRHSVVNGIHFIQLNATNYDLGEILFTKEVREFLKERLEIAAKDAPGKPIFVLTHTSTPGTVAGSSLQTALFPTLVWSTDELRECLSAYPQVIQLSGHTHYSQNNERTIFQDDYTMINVGPMHYTTSDYGFFNCGENHSSLPEEYSEHPQAMMFDVDKNGTVRLRRYDIGLLKQQGEDWFIKAPGYEDSLSDFRSDRAAKPGPTFNTKDLAATAAGGNITLTFSRASGNASQVYYYAICVKDASGKEILERRYMSDLFISPQEADMRPRWEIVLEGLNAGKYTIDVTACNVWHALGDTQAVTVEV